MRTWRAHTCGDPADVLVLDDVPEPTLTAGFALVEVLAVGLSYADVLMCRGEYQIETPLPYVPGGETVGMVRAVAEPATHGHLVGKKVLVLGGGLSEWVKEPYECLFVIDDQADVTTMAAIIVNYATAEYCLERVRPVGEKDWVLVLGASGGVGSAAVDYAKFLGCRTIAVVGGERKAAAIRERGCADVVLDYSAEPDFRGRVREETEGKGVAACIDPVGGAATDVARRCIGFRGTYIVAGFASEIAPTIPLNHVLVKGYDVAGANWGVFILHHPEEVAPTVRRLVERAACGDLSPLVSEYKFADALEGLLAHARRQSIGKAVVRVGG